MIQRALVVDSSLTVRMDIGEALEAAGFVAVPCATLGAARQAFHDGECVLVVLEATLPDGDGLDFLASLKNAEATRAIPVLLLSDDASGRAAMADARVGKPYDVAQLVVRALAR